MINIRAVGEAHSGEFFTFEKKTYSIVGDRTGTRYTLGDPITFKVIGADVDKKTLDYQLV
jgi:ribonuclease R